MVSLEKVHSWMGHFCTSQEQNLEKLYYQA